MATKKQMYLELRKNKKIIDALYKRNEKIVKHLVSKLGHGHEEVIQVEDPSEDEAPFMRIRLYDNAKTFSNGTDVLWGHAAIRHFDAKIDYLKNPLKIKNVEKTEK